MNMSENLEKVLLLWSLSGHTLPKALCLCEQKQLRQQKVAMDSLLAH